MRGLGTEFRHGLEQPPVDFLRRLRRVLRRLRRKLLGIVGKNVPLLLLDRIERQIYRSPVEIRPRIFHQVGWKFPPKQPQEDRLRNVLGVLGVSHHAIRRAIRIW